MDSEDFKIAWEKPIHKSLDSLFDRASLTQEEREIYINYKKHCKYWLLRSKLGDSQAFDTNHPNFIKLLARVLINLQHDNVSGPKDHLVKELFSNKTVHRFIKTKSGIRSTKISGKIPNTFFSFTLCNSVFSY